MQARRSLSIPRWHQDCHVPSPLPTLQDIAKYHVKNPCTFDLEYRVNRTVDPRTDGRQYICALMSFYAILATQVSVCLSPTTFPVCTLPVRVLLRTFSSARLYCYHNDRYPARLPAPSTVRRCEPYRVTSDRTRLSFDMLPCFHFLNPSHLRDCCFSTVSAFYVTLLASRRQKHTGR